MRSHILLRRRLLDFLHAHLDRRITTISAPAGYGKTTLAATFVVDAELPACWYSLDEGDNDPTQFLEYLVTTIQLRFPEFGSRTRSALQTGSPDLTRLVGTLVTELYTDIPDAFLLVLDDLHVLRPHTALAAALDSLLVHAPEHCRILLLSRAAVDLPSLPKLTANRQVMRLTVRDLTFNDDEAQALLECWGVQGTAETRQRVLRMCEGWAAGLVLSSLESAGSQSMEHPSPDSDTLFRYLASEVYERQSPSDQDFLRRSSVLYELSAASCTAVLGVQASAEKLRQLSDSLQFITGLEGNEVYRYHSLFRSFLAGRLGQDEEERAGVHRRAGEYFSAQRHWEAAVFHYRESADKNELARAIEQAAGDLYAAGRWSRLSGWIDELPDETLDAHPILLIYRARSAVQLGRAEKAMRDCARAQELVEQVAPDLCAQVHVARASALRLQGKAERCIEESQAAMALLPDIQTAGARLVHAQACHYKGMALLEQGRFREAMNPLTAALEGYQEIGDLFGASLAHHHLGSASRKLARYTEALGHYTEALSGWNRLDNRSRLASTLNNLGNLHAEQDPVRAEQTLREAAGCASEAGATRILAHALDSLGFVLLIQGNYQEAFTAYEEAREAAGVASEHLVQVTATHGMGLIRLATGDVNRASLCFDEAAGLAGEHSGPEITARILTSRALLAMARNHSKRARRFLREAGALLGESGSRENLARYHFYLASWQWSTGERGADATLSLLARLLREPGSELMLIPDARLAIPFTRHLASLPGFGDSFKRVLAGIEHFRPQVPAPFGGAQGTPELPNLVQNVFPLVRAHALGRTRVEVEEAQPREVHWTFDKSKELLFFLLAHDPTVRKEEIIAALWPDAPTTKADTLFWATTYRLRRGLYQACLVRRDNVYGLNPEGSFWFDAREFKAQVQAGFQGMKDDPVSGDYVAILEEALRLYEGPFLAELYSDWAAEVRDRLLDQFLAALLVLARNYVERGAVDRVVELCDRALGCDPLLEDAYFLKIQALAGAGRTPEADLTYRRYARVVQEELGVPPDGKLVELRQQIRMGQYA